MGGFVSGLFSKAGDLIEKGMLETKVGRAVDDLAASKLYDLDKTPEGIKLKSNIKEIHRAEAEYRDRLEDPRGKLWSGIKQGPSRLEKQLKLGTSKMRDVHNELVRQGSPLQNYSRQVMAQNVQRIAGVNVPKNAGLTIHDVGYQNEKQATFLAIRKVLGSNYQVIMPDLMKLLESPDAVERMLGERYADTLADEFRDRGVMTGRTRKGPSKQSESRIKVELNKIISASNKARRAAGAPEVSLLRTEPTYSTPGKVERVYTGFLRTTQAVFAFIPHVSMEFNLALRSPFKPLIEGTLSMNEAQIKAARDAAHIMSVQAADMMQQEIAISTGKISKLIGPTAARVVDKVFHVPLFHPTRNFEIKNAGAVGFKTAEYWAGKLVNNQRVKAAEAAFKDMEIDPADVRAQNGVLTPEQYQKAVYHYTQRTMFLRSGMHMPITANSNVLTRSYNMYHFFVRGQFMFLKDTLLTMIKARDYAGLARYISVLGVAWPNVAPILMGAATLLRTGSPSQAGQNISDKYRKLYNPSGAYEWTYNYISLLAHMGAVSDYMNYWDSVANYGLLKTVIGPKLSTPWVYIQDAMQAGRGMSSKPLARDILQTVPVVGKPASHILVPTKKEEGPKPHIRGVPKFRAHRGRGRR